MPYGGKSKMSEPFSLVHVAVSVVAFGGRALDKLSIRRRKPQRYRDTIQPSDSNSIRKLKQDDSQRDSLAFSTAHDSRHPKIDYTTDSIVPEAPYTIPVLLGEINSTTSLPDSVESRSIASRTSINVNNDDESEESTIRVAVGREHETSLKDSSLISLAWACMYLDEAVFQFIETLIQSFKNENNETRERGISGIQEPLLDLGQKLEHEIQAIKTQFASVKSRQLDFGIGYFVEGNLVGIYKKFHQIMSACDDDHKNTWQLSTMVADILTFACNTERYITELGAKELLSWKVMNTFAVRWEVLDCLRIPSQHVYITIGFSSWDLIVKRIEEAKRAPPNLNATKTAKSLKLESVILWYTFLATVVYTPISFALAYYYSTHEVGTTKDADFWFLTQSSVSQGFAVVISGIGLWKRPGLPWHIWVIPSVLALLCCIIAVPLYGIIATEWSGLLNMFVGSFQSFMVLQLMMIPEVGQYAPIGVNRAV